MTGANTALLALAALLAIPGLAWFTVHAIRVGFDYMSARGNPRNRAGAHESARDLILGAAIVIFAITGSAAIWHALSPAAG